MKKVFGLLFVFAIVINFVIAQQEAIRVSDSKRILLFDNGTWIEADKLSTENIIPVKTQLPEIPATGKNDQIITHTGFSLLYSNKHKQAFWVAYELTREKTRKIFERTNRFMVDPKVKTGTANDNDYKKSGYDRGHLAPASDMGWSEKAMAESFYYSNISPQIPSFNRGGWKKLEELVRTWAVENDTIYIVTGPVLNDNLKKIGSNNVSVPDYFYKVVLDYSLPHVKGIGFIMPNAAINKPLYQYAVTIDSVEKLCGIDFFYKLPDEQEYIIEQSLCIDCWTWGAEKQKTLSKKVTEKLAQQCNGVTKKGERCKIKTQNASGFCYLHEQQQNQNYNQNLKPYSDANPVKSVQCSGITKAGTRCKRMTTNPSGRCFQH